MMLARGRAVCRRNVHILPSQTGSRVSSLSDNTIGPGRALACRAMDNGKPEADRPIDVIIADDHSVVRDGIRTALERTDGEFRVVGETADVPSTIREVRELKPDLLTLDL